MANNSGSNTGKKPRPNLREMINRDKRVIILVGVLLLLVVAGALLRDKLSPKNTGTINPVVNLPGNSGGSKPGNQVEVLPQVERPTDSPVPLDPFLGPVELVGVITGGTGSNVAIIRTQSATHIVRVGDKIMDYWLVKEIRPAKVILHSEDRDLQLDISNGAGL